MVKNLYYKNKITIKQHNILHLTVAPLDKRTCHLLFTDTLTGMQAAKGTLQIEATEVFVSTDKMLYEKYSSLETLMT